MSNESINDLSVAFNNILKTVETLVQQEIELLNMGIKAAGAVIEPLVKTSSDLVGNVLNTVGQIFQNITCAFTPKK
jgi:chlorosome envelope protein B